MTTSGPLTIRITHDGNTVTVFERDSHDRWREAPDPSEGWKATHAKTRISADRSKRRGAPWGMLDKQDAPHYCGIPYLVRLGGRPVKLLDGPSQWSWEDGVATFFMPRDGDTLPGGDGVIEIKYEFPDGGAAIWHHNVAPALDILAAQGCEDATLNVLRQVVNRRNQQSRHNTH